MIEFTICLSIYLLMLGITVFIVFPIGINRKFWYFIPEQQKTSYQPGRYGFLIAKGYENEDKIKEEVKFKYEE